MNRERRRFSYCIYIIIIGSLLCVNPSTVFGQLTNPVGDVETKPGDIALTYVTIVGSQVDSDFEPGSGENEYNWLNWWVGFWPQSTPICIKHDSVDPGEFPDDKSFVTPTNPMIISDFKSKPQTFGMEAYEADGNESDRCHYQSGDDGHCLVTNTINFYDYPPILNNEFFVYCTNFWSRIHFAYNLPKPAAPVVVNANPNDNYCGGSAPIRLRTEAFFKPDHLSRLNFFATWEYRMGSSSVWKTIGNTPYTYNAGIASSPISEIDIVLTTLPELANATKNETIFFRVSTKAVDNMSQLHSSVTTEGNVFKVSPLAPAIVSVNPTASCPSASTGKVTLNVNSKIAGNTNFRYIVRAGENTAPCDPSIPGNCGGIGSNDVNTTTFDIPGFSKGKFTILVANPGGTMGACYSYAIVDVPEIPLLQFQSPNIGTISCPGGSDGNIKLASNGGIAPFTYSLSKGGVAVTGNNGEYSNLITGDYTASVTDGCTQLVTSVVKVTEPLSIVAGLSPSNPSCISPSDGSIQVDVSQGEGKYNFQLLKDGQIVNELSNATVSQWKTANLSEGSYSVKIVDAQRTQCIGYTSSADLVKPKVLSITQGDIAPTDLTCFQQKDGSIKLSNVDVSGIVKYTITGSTTGQTQSITNTAVFKDLAADQYSLVITRSNAACTDQFSFADLISVKQPDDLKVSLIPSNISCFDRADGKIQSSITGGTSSDSYQWEIQLGGSWSTLPYTTASLSNISEGSYRMKIRNANNCQAESEVVTISEPANLIFSSVKATDIKCYGETGQVETILTGGTAPYIHEFSYQGGVAQGSGTTTNLSAGTYSLTTKDQNGCATTYPNAIIITSPSTALTVKHTLSDYSGFNISCKGAANGIIELIPSGGNGGAYSGYSYSMDDGAFNNVSRIKNIDKGDHIFRVMDARGCTREVTAHFTEPQGTLAIQLVDKSIVKCQNDSDGFLSIKADGGTAPYSFRINNVRTQNDGTFLNLPGGDYTIVVTDVNGCSEVYQDHIDVQNPPIDIAFLKKDATCFGTKSGSISAEISGGAPPLSQQWSDGTRNIISTDSLRAGIYTVKVTDNQGCSAEKVITITQPEDIVTTISTIPVCVGKTTGEIHVVASGGAGSYSYAVDGSIFQLDPVLKNISGGSHRLAIKDANGCIHADTALVVTRNDLPKPDFIVASDRNALDTLIIHEISVPKPDSVQWTFDPKITVVQWDRWSPEIKVDEAGTYSVSMKGYFGGCDYTTQLTLSINPYDPENVKGKSDVPIAMIKDMKVTPNPNAGDFTVTVELNSKEKMSLNVIDITGSSLYQESWSNTLHVEKDIHLDVNLTGVYIVRAITETDAQEVRIVINK